MACSEFQNITLLANSRLNGIHTIMTMMMMITCRICSELKDHYHTLNREPIDENFDDLDESSDKGGNRPETKGHLEALRSA